MKEIYLAGGCFWGVEEYFRRLDGILETEVGYANGKTQNPTYEQVCTKTTAFAETVFLRYDEQIIPLKDLLRRYFRIIDPTSLDRQGPDVGNQYRTGIYYLDETDLPTIEHEMNELAKKYSDKIQVEVTPLINYYRAEEYHQKYLVKNPAGYCHVDLGLAEEELLEAPTFTKKSGEELKNELSSLQYDVTQHSHTEPPFRNEYYNLFEEGIYVDITTGEPLFLSTDKFESGCGWPSFAKPIDNSLMAYFNDDSYGMNRTEVRSALGDAHLGHIFPDGPEELGGMRYCINSAALRFIPKEQMSERGYDFWLKYFR